MFKRFLSTVLDVILILTQVIIFSLVILLITNALFIKGNPETITTILSQSLTPLILVAYVLGLGLIYINFVFLPLKHHQTLAMSLLKLEYVPTNQVTHQSLLFHNIIGNFWAWLLFPVQLIVIVTKKTTLNSIISNLEVKPADSKARGPKTIAIINLAFLIPIITLAVLIYTKGVYFVIDKFIDYKEQTKIYITQGNWEQAEYALEKYEQQKGQTADYFYLACQINVNQKEYEEGEISCAKALEGTSDSDQKQEILLWQANLYNDQDKTEETSAVYEELWVDYKYRSLDILPYALLLDDQKKIEEAINVVTEVKNANGGLTTEDLYIIDRLMADLLLKDEQHKKAQTMYLDLYTQVKDGKVNLNQLNLEKNTVLSDLEFLIGKTYYFQKEYKKAQEYFDLAVEHNENYSDLVESYKIDIYLKKK